MALTSRRTQAEPCFYQYCHFCFWVGFCREESYSAGTEESHHAGNCALRRAIPLMKRIVFKTRNLRLHDWLLPGFIENCVRIPVWDGPTLPLPDTFSNVHSQGRQMEFHIINLLFFDLYDSRKSGRIATKLEILHSFRHFHTVKFFLNISTTELRPIHRQSPMIAKQCAYFLRDFRLSLEPVLGPRVTVVTVDGTEGLYSDYTVYHPRSHQEAKERQNTSD